MYKWSGGWKAPEKENHKAHGQRDDKSRGHMTLQRRGDGNCFVPMAPQFWSFQRASCASYHEIFLSPPNKPPSLGLGLLKRLLFLAFPKCEVMPLSLNLSP